MEFLFGIVIGGIIGVFFMCLFQVTRESRLVEPKKATEARWLFVCDA